MTQATTRTKNPIMARMPMPDVSPWASFFSRIRWTVAPMAALAHTPI